MCRPGPCVDLYYYDGETHQKQCFPTTQNTKYVQQFQNLTGGSSVFTIPPQQGIQDVVLEMGFAPVATGTGLALPRGWGYGLIKQVSFRYGGSSQYFLTGDQLLQNALRRQTSRSSANDILTLGGQYADAASAGGVSNGVSSNNITTATQTALVVLTLPHSIPSGVGKSHPFPSDLLTQQIQVTVELYPVNQIWSTSSGGTAPPTTLSFGQFQVQQVILNNQGDALARRVDMSQNAYAFPAEFVQQKQSIVAASLNNTTSPQEVVLTGFRSGEVKSLMVWMTRSSETNLNTTGTGGNASYQPNKWYLPAAIQMSYAGDIYARYDYQSSLIWNLINGNKAPVVDTVQITAGGTPTPSAFLSQWVELPFAQTNVDDDSHNTLVHGKPITNGIVNLTVTPPSAQTDWVVNVSYVYNTTLLMSQGTCDFVF